MLQVVEQYLGICLHSAPRRVSAPRFKTITPVSNKLIQHSKDFVKEKKEQYAREIIGDTANEIFNKIEAVGNGYVYDEISL